MAHRTGAHTVRVRQCQLGRRLCKSAYRHSAKPLASGEAATSAMVNCEEFVLSICCPLITRSRAVSGHPRSAASCQPISGSLAILVDPPKIQTHVARTDPRIEYADGGREGVFDGT